MKKLLAILLGLMCLSFHAHSQNTFPSSGSAGIGTTNPAAPLEIRQAVDPAGDRGLIISEPNNSQRIFLHLANNRAGQYGYFGLGGETRLRGNGQPSSFDGRVGVGTTKPREALDVNGTVRAKEVRVEASPWPDFVFAEGYPLMPLEATASYIAAQGHLPGIPSAADVAANGVAIGAMNAKLLQKIEELTLHAIALQAQLKSQQETMARMQAENANLRAMERRLEALEKSIIENKAKQP